MAWRQCLRGIASGFRHPPKTYSLNSEQRPWLTFNAAFSKVQGISTSCSTLQASTNGNEAPVPSPFSMVPTAVDAGKPGGKHLAKPKTTQAVLKNIRQSPKKMNLVAKLVRGMRVQDALMQLEVTVKRAAKTITTVIRSACANATHNHGMDGDRLIVAECFVGKGRYLKRVRPHGKGKSGIMHHPFCRVTVIVKELTAEQEAEIAKIKTMHFRERRKYKSKLVPHRLLESTWDWHRRPREVTYTAIES